MVFEWRGLFFLKKEDDSTLIDLISPRHHRLAGVNYKLQIEAVKAWHSTGSVRH